MDDVAEVISSVRGQSLLQIQMFACKAGILEWNISLHRTLVCDRVLFAQYNKSAWIDRYLSHPQANLVLFSRESSWPPVVAVELGERKFLALDDLPPTHTLDRILVHTIADHGDNTKAATDSTSADIIRTNKTED